MKTSQYLGNGCQVFVDRCAAVHQCCEPGGVGMAAHHDHRFGWTIFRIGEMGHPEIAVRSEALVQGDLMLASALPVSSGAEIQKVGNHWLLDFVRPVSEQDNDTGVRLSHLRGQVTREGAPGLLTRARTRRSAFNIPNGGPPSSATPEH